MSKPNKYKVYWSFQANEDLADIYAYIGKDAPTAAEIPSTNSSNPIFQLSGFHL